MCSSIFDEEMDTWRVISDCGDPKCASSAEVDVNAAVERAKQARGY